MTQKEYDEEARHIRRQLVAQAQSLLGDEADAEDTVQDALLRLWQMLEVLHRPMEPLARRLVRNLAIDRLRRRKPTLSVNLLSEQNEVARPDTERIERTMRIVETLPDMQQTLLRLRHMDGLSMADIASLTGASQEAVRKSLSRARQTILEIYKQQETWKN